MKWTLLFLFLILLNNNIKVQAATATCIATYESIGIYWAAENGSNTTDCTVQYRKDGSSTWLKGFNLVWDSRASVNVYGNVNRGLEYRGSIVLLTPATKYNIQLSAGGSTATLSCTTWSETYTIKSTINLKGTTNATVTIDQGGDETGYVRYTLDGTINADPLTLRYALVITAPYVIVDGFKIKGGGTNAVQVTGNAHDLVIQNSDISGWGTILCDGYGRDYDAGIRYASNLTRITIQRNVIHDPRTTANGWCDPIQGADVRCDAGEPTPAPPTNSSGCSFHPQGPQGIVTWNSIGNNVIRYNRIDAGIETGHYFNDAIGGGENAGNIGFPGADCDIYGNWFGSSVDDQLEIEGGNMNVRVWGNFVNSTYTGIATATTSVGPLYIFRNVMHLSRRSPRTPEYFTDSSSGPFAKLGDFSGYGRGRRFYFHNTMLGGPLQGGRPGLGGSSTLPMTNTWSRNNVWWCTSISYSRNQACYGLSTVNVSGNSLDWDMCSQRSGAAYQTTNGIIDAIPVFKYGSEYCKGSDTHTISCNFILNTTSQGYDAGTPLNGFNDGYYGTAPDMGAHEDNSAPLQYGINAYKSSSTTTSTTKSGTTSTGTGSSDSTTTTGTTTPTPASDGDSSAASLAAGVLFVATILLLA